MVVVRILRTRKVKESERENLLSRRREVGSLPNKESKGERIRLC